MLFKKTSYLHQWQKNKNISLFEKKFIFASQPSTAEVQSNDHGLPDEYVHGQDILENRARQIDTEMNTRKKRGITKRILAGIFKRGEEHTDDLQTTRDVCGTKLDLLKAPIQNDQDFEVALKDVGSFNRSLGILRSPQLDNSSLADLQSSGLGSFFSSKLKERLDYSKSKMKARQMLNNLLLLSKSEPQLSDQANEDWKEHEGLVREQLKVAKNRDVVDFNEVQEIQADLKNQTNWINRRIAELQAQHKIETDNNENLTFLKSEEGQALKESDPDVYDLMMQQATRGEIDELRLRRTTRKIEADQQKIDLSSFLGYEEKLEINGILLEAREMKEAQVRAYLESRFKTTSDKLAKVQGKEPPRFSDIELRQFKEIFNFFESGLLGQAQLLREGQIINIPSHGGSTATMACGPDAVKKLLDGLNSADASIDGLDKKYDDFLVDVNKDPEGFKAQIHQRLRKAEEATAAFTPERIDELLAKLEEPEFKLSPDYNKRKTAFMELRDGNMLGQQMDEVREQVANMDSLPISKLSGLSDDLIQIERILSAFSGEQIDTALNPDRVREIGTAKQILQEVSQLEDPVQIRAVLENKLDDDNLDFVDANTFKNYPDPVTGKEKNLTLHAKDLGMVFYESADNKKWKIIIRWPITDAEKTLFKEGVMHETRHMLFDKDPKTRKKWEMACLNNSKWEDIKNSFITAIQPKKPPHGEVWEDEHILSEMYAIGDPIFDGGNKFNEVSELMKTYGITDQLLGLSKQPRLVDGKVAEDGSYSGFENPDDAESIMEQDTGETLSSKSSESDSEGGEEGYGASYELFKTKIDVSKSEIKRMLSSNYLGFVPGSKKMLNLLKQYNNITEELNNSFKDSNSKYLSLEIKDRNEVTEKELANLNREMAEAGDYMPHEDMGPVRDLWNRTTFLALDDILAVGSNIKEWWERRHKRNIDNNAAKVGSAMFNNIPLPIIGEFGQEAEARKEKAELEEVNEWQSRWENKDSWELIDIMHNMVNNVNPNKDALKAILRLLAKNGRINWRDEELWKILNKLQSSASLMPGDQTLLKNPILLRQKLHQAIGEIYDYDEFWSLEKENESSWDSNIQKYMPSLDKIQDQLTERMDQLLKKHRNGEHVDPMEYEALMEYGITKGKSFAEAVFFHLIVGMADGLLPPDRGLALDKHLNAYPATQWIYSKQPPLTKADYIRIAENKFGDSYARGSIHPDQGDNNDFMDFYWTEVQNDEMTIQRVRKSVSERDWDHDWGRSIACMGDSNTAKRWLAGKSGQQEAKDTGVENAYVGALMWLENNANASHKIDARKEFARQMSWVTMADGIIDHVAYLSEGDTYTRGNASILNATAREASLSGHKGWTTSQFRNKIRGFLDRFDPKFFALIRDQKKAKTDKKKHGQEVKQYLMEKYPSLRAEVDSVQSIDDIFNKMDAIVQAIIGSVPDDEFNAALASIAKPSK